MNSVGVTFKDYCCSSISSINSTPSNTVTINIITGECGSGKTTWIIEQIKNSKDRVIYLNLTHDVLGEVAEKLPKGSFVHWYGIKHLCPKYGKDEFITKLIENGLPTHIICKVCYKLSRTTMCRYKRQFKLNKRIILAPEEYLFTKALIYSGGKIVFVDEVPFKCLVFRRPRKEILLQLKYLLRNLGITKFSDFPGLEKTIEKTIELYLEQGDLDVKVFMEYIEAMRWLYFYRKYRLRQDYGRPYLFYVFDLARTKKVYLSDAMFIKKYYRNFLADMVQRYFAEEGVKVNFRVAKNLEVPRTKSQLIKFNPKAWYPSKSISIKRITNIINKIVKQECPRKPGIVCPKELETLFKEMTPNVEHFWNLRSSNKLIDCDIGFVVGTPTIPPSELVKQFKLFYPNYTPITDSDKQEGLGYVYKDSKLEQFKLCLIETELMNAIHRFRPLIKNTKVYVFSKLPEDPEMETHVLEYINETSMFTRKIYEPTEKLGLTIEPNKAVIRIPKKIRELLEKTRQKIRIELVLQGEQVKEVSFKLQRKESDSTTK